MTIMSSVRMHTGWRHVISNLANFNDVTTVRHMLKDLQLELEEETAFRITLARHPDVLATWVEDSEPAVEVAKVFVKELEDWLHARDLVAR